jgi:hypothetical protein
LQARDDAASLTATAAVALTLGTASVIDAGNPALILCVLAGLVAAFSSLFRLPRPLGT